MSALSKGFAILEAVTANRGGLSFSDIVNATDLPKGSVHRLLKELCELGALSYDDSAREYHGGLVLARLGASVAASYDIRRVARPHLEALHAATGNVATLGIRNGETGTYIDKIEPAELIVRLHSEVGKSFPLHCTAMGKVLLAHSDPQTIQKVTRRKLRAYTDNTISDGKQLREELDEVLEQGYAVDREEITRGLICIAAPIRGPEGNVSAAISSTISSFEATPAILQDLGDAVRAAAQGASNG